MPKSQNILPLGTQDFEKLVNNKALYVDKTDYLSKIISSGPKAFYLSRPRRFGKSLLVSTFEAIFSGKKELFKGLEIEKSLEEKLFAPRPVIALDMSSITTRQGVAGLEPSLRRITASIAARLGVEMERDIPSNEALVRLIQRSRDQAGRDVVVLIDGYDKPLWDFVENPAEAEAARMTLRNYYSQLKVCDGNISFIFITGVSKFSSMGFISGLNTVVDISIMPEYGSICGFTQAELESRFAEHVEAAANHLGMSDGELLEKLQDYYGGFCFDGSSRVRVYNPFSTIQFFFKKDFKNYWLESETSYNLVKYLKKKSLTVEQFRGFPISKDFAYAPGEIDVTPPHGRLYQAGYLSLRPGKHPEYLTLDYPNREARVAMSRLLTESFIGDASGYEGERLRGALASGDVVGVIKRFNALLGAVPYDDYSQANRELIKERFPDIDFGEWLYRSVLLSFLIGSGLDFLPEAQESLGRSDLALKVGGLVWVMELKVFREEGKDEATADEGLSQALAKGYGRAYDDPLIIGLAVNDANRAITAWKARRDGGRFETGRVDDD